MSDWNRTIQKMNADPSILTPADEGAAVERLREAMANKANEIRLQSLAGLEEGTPPILGLVVRRADLDTVLAALKEAERKVGKMQPALERIARWFGEFPDTGRTWDDGSSMSYAACYGSNGERDFMREIAAAALLAEADGELK